MMINWVLLLVNILVPYLFYYSFGKSHFVFFDRVVCKFLDRLKVSSFDFEDLSETGVVFLWVLGLLSHLLLSIIFYLVGLNLFLSFWFAFLFLLVSSYRVPLNFLKKIAKIDFLKFYPSINMTVFIFVILVSGISLFDADKGIRTLWVNNYGDLPFHLGMIANFNFSNSPLLEYHIFPGAILSYPFMINFWSSLLWVPETSWKGLSFIFLIQWSTVWIVCYLLLRKSFYGVLPWVLFFSGGTLPVLFANLNFSVPNITTNLSHKFITEGYPFTVLLSTVWVTQRTSIMGLLFAISILCFIFDNLKRKPESSNITIFIVSGFMAGFALFSHFYFVFISVSFILSVLFFDFVSNYEDKKYFQRFIVFLICFLISSIPAIILYSSKSSMLELSSGWMLTNHLSESISWFPEFYGLNVDYWLLDLISMWVLNLGIWIVIFSILSISWSWKFTFSLVILFVAGNFLKMSVWDWDRIKFFIPLLFILLVLVRHFYQKKDLLLLTCFVVAMLPSLVETFKIFSDANYSVVYSEKDLLLAEEIRKETFPDAVIAARPRHNSVVTLAGRRIFSGFDGWLNSHGIKYTPRKEQFSNLNNIIKCREGLKNEVARKVCPDYLFEHPEREKFWNASDNFLDKLDKTKVSGLYRISY